MTIPLRTLLILLLISFTLTQMSCNSCTRVASPSELELKRPPAADARGPEEEELKKVKEEKVMTLILGENDQVHYYQGMTNERGLKTTDFDTEGVRDVIQSHLKRYPKPCPPKAKNTDNCWDPVFVVKPNKTSTYRNLVDILDELKISGANKYAIQDITPADSMFLVDQNLK